MKKLILFVSVLMLSILSGLAAQDRPTVLATNAWTAAFVEMAGGEAEMLAPANMVHPPEYELKISDVVKIREADFLVYGGYEVLMKTVFESFEKPEDTMIQIMTSYAPETVERSVMTIAEKIGTEGKARENIEAYKAFISEGRNRLKEAGLFGKEVVANFHQRPLIQALGFNVLGVFGPQPLTPGTISELGKLRPDLILDNIHNPMAAPLEEILGKEALVLINFPGFPLENGKRTPTDLPSVALYNLEEILSIR